MNYDIEEHIYPDGGGWRKPLVVNDWARERTYLRKRTRYGTNRLDEQEESERLAPGRMVEVRWPDGSETTETIRGEFKRVSYGDMGHTYETSTEVLYIEKTANGASFKFYDIKALWFRFPQQG